MNILDNDCNNNIFLGHMLSHGYYPLINSITRSNTCNTNGSCIYVFAKTTLSCKSIVPNQRFSDYFPIFAVIDLKSCVEAHNNTNYSYIAYNKLNDVSKQLNWNHILKINNPDIALEELKNCKNRCILSFNKNSKPKIIKKKYRKNWMTKGLPNSINLKDFL